MVTIPQSKESTMPFHINRRHHDVKKHKPKMATRDYINNQR